mgnify:FL=1
MKNIYQLILISCFVSFLRAELSIENAFPDLSFQDPVGIYHAGDGSNRIFVLEQEGRIKVFENDPAASSAQMFLDITSIVDQDGGYTEEGLLGLAFHPNYSENGYFYVNYTEHNPRRNVIARYTVSVNNPNQANYGSSEIILEVNQPYTNHNGGQMEFGPNDGYLYISFGDGGSGGDPLGHGQNLSTLLGSIIRIDVDNPSENLNYSIPSDNPFTIPLNARDEIYAYGLRNTWKFSWDQETGLLWGADVGQNSYEEINIINPGLNYGWNIMEATHCYSPPNNCNEDGLTLPVWEYELYVNGVCSITGGYVYRGSDLFSLVGQYIYGDWCTGDIWALDYSDNEYYDNHLINTGLNITSFGIDQDNELLICDHNGGIYRLTTNLGDINDDGSLNVLDIVSLVNLILANEYNSVVDLNEDSFLNVLDVVLLINAILD